MSEILDELFIIEMCAELYKCLGLDCGKNKILILLQQHVPIRLSVLSFKRRYITRSGCENVLGYIGVAM